jgi:hypothetical protein
MVDGGELFWYRFISMRWMMMDDVAQDDIYL